MNNYAAHDCMGMIACYLRMAQRNLFCVCYSFSTTFHAILAQAYCFLNLNKTNVSSVNYRQMLRKHNYRLSFVYLG